LLMTPGGNQWLHQVELADAEGHQVLVAPGSGYRLFMALPDGVSPRYAMLIKQQTLAGCGNSSCHCA